MDSLHFQNIQMLCTKNASLSGKFQRIEVRYKLRCELDTFVAHSYRLTCGFNDFSPKCQACIAHITSLLESDRSVPDGAFLTMETRPEDLPVN